MSEQPEDLLPSRLLPARYNVDRTTIFRWRKDPAIAFPTPDAIIGGSEFFKRSTLERFEEASRQNPTRKFGARA